MGNDEGFSAYEHRVYILVWYYQFYFFHCMVNSNCRVNI